MSYRSISRRLKWQSSNSNDVYSKQLNSKYFKHYKKDKNCLKITSYFSTILALKNVVILNKILEDNEIKNG